MWEMGLLILLGNGKSITKYTFADFYGLRIYPKKLRLRKSQQFFFASPKAHEFPVSPRWFAAMEEWRMRTLLILGLPEMGKGSEATSHFGKSQYPQGSHSPFLHRGEPSRRNWKREGSSFQFPATAKIAVAVFWDKSVIRKNPQKYIL